MDVRAIRISRAKARLVNLLVELLPSEMSEEDMQGLVDNPDGLRKFLQGITKVARSPSVARKSEPKEEVRLRLPRVTSERRDVFSRRGVRLRLPKRAPGGG